MGAHKTPNRVRWINRLRDWERELRDNKNGMAHLAPRAIAVLRKDIEYYWPGALDDRPTDPGSA